MDFDTLRRLLASKPDATEGFPFGPQALVFKVHGKMFAVMRMDGEPLRATLKCDPAEAEALRAKYPAVQPGYHMNKRHWNTITVDGTVPSKALREMIDTSYSLVVRSLSKSEREGLAA